MDMRGFLKELGCVYTSLLEPTGFDSAENKLRLLEYLATELAACRINTVNGTGPSAHTMDVDDVGADSGDAALMTQGIVRTLGLTAGTVREREDGKIAEEILAYAYVCIYPSACVRACVRACACESCVRACVRACACECPSVYALCAPECVWLC